MSNEHAILRKLIEACTRTISLATTGESYSAEKVREITTAVSQRVREIADEGEWNDADAVGLRSAVKIAFQVIHERYEKKDELAGLPTGFVELDALLGGMHSGELIAIASEPCAGKSALAAHIALHVATVAKLPVCVFSMKRAVAEYALRLIAALGPIDREHLRDGQIREKDWPRVTNALKALSDASVIIDATPCQSAASLRARMRGMRSMHPVRLVVIDHLELMDQPDLASELRAFAREFDTTVMVLAQTKGSVGEYARLMDRSLENHADVILLLDRDQSISGESRNKQEARIVIARNRNGRTGSVKLRYQSQYTRWSNDKSERTDSVVNGAKALNKRNLSHTSGLRDEVEASKNGKPDELYDKAVAIVTKYRQASTSIVQRRLKIGCNRATHLIEQMEQQGLVSAPQQDGHREVLVPPPEE